MTQDELLTKVRELWKQNQYIDIEHTKHIAIRLINEDSEKNHTAWNKCNNCGYPFIENYAGATKDHCSVKCETANIKYINNPDDHDSHYYPDPQYDPNHYGSYLHVEDY